MMTTITPKQLSDIVTTLLINPDGVGELADSQSHQGFFSDIAQVVADYCGGEVTEPTTDQPEGLRADVLANDSLPDHDNNVWNDSLWRTELSSTIALSVAHLSPDTMQRLTEEAESGENYMIVARDTGFFVKLYASTGDHDEEFDPLGGNSHERFPCPSFHRLMWWASRNGIAVVEFDVDGSTLEQFELFDH